MKTQITGFRKPNDITRALKSFDGQISDVILRGYNAQDMVAEIIYEEGENDLSFAHGEDLNNMEEFAATFSGIRFAVSAQWYKRGTVGIVGYTGEGEPALSREEEDGPRPQLDEDPRIQRLIRKAKDGCDKQRTEATRLLKEVAEEDD